MVFEEELKDINNVKIMQHASRPFAGLLRPDELDNCRLIALWKTVDDFQPQKGSKFTSILYNRVRWECIREIKCTRPIPAVSIVGSGNIEDKGQYFGGIDDIICDIPAEYRDVLFQRFVEDKTFDEIGQSNGYSGENARIKTKKALEYVKELIKE